MYGLSSRPIGLPVAGVVSDEAHLPGDHVFRHLSQRAVVAEGVRP
jgi:hypothetical protein